MPEPSNTLLIEGSFSELSEELAQYIDSLNKVDENSGVVAEITPILAEIRQTESNEQPPDDDVHLQKQKENVLKSLVKNGAVLNSAPEKGKLSKTAT